MFPCGFPSYLPALAGMETFWRGLPLVSFSAPAPARHLVPHIFFPISLTRQQPPAVRFKNGHNGYRRPRRIKCAAPAAAAREEQIMNKCCKIIPVLVASASLLRRLVLLLVGGGAAAA